MKALVHYLQRILFLAAFVIIGLAVAEKSLNAIGYTFLTEYYAPSRLLEFAAISLLFVIVLQLREISMMLNPKEPVGGRKKPE